MQLSEPMAPGLPLRSLLLILAIVAGVSIANIYYNQPLLDSIRLSFPHQDSWIGAVPGAGQIGFAIGMLLLAPLGDRLDRRRLILSQIVGLCLALIATAMASSLFMLIVLMIALAVLVARYLPASRPTSTLSYDKLLASLWRLFLEFRVLREAALTGAALFAAFSLFWSVLSLLLAHPPFNLGPAASGLFGIVAAAGAITAPWAGKCSDRWGSRMAISIAIGLVALSFVVFSFSGSSLAGLVIGVIVLDVGLQVAQTPNQSRIFALAPEARSRLNTVYMICYFCGGALGSAIGVFAWQTVGWQGACGVGIFFAAVAACSHFRGN